MDGLLQPANLCSTHRVELAGDALAAAAGALRAGRLRRRRRLPEAGLRVQAPRAGHAEVAACTVHCVPRECFAPSLETKSVSLCGTYVLRPSSAATAVQVIP